MPMTTTIEQLKPWNRNPRTIKAAAAEGLKASLDEFGDLGGIVFNVRLQALVGGHQRTSILPADAQIEIDRRYDEPTRTGTIAEGSVIIKGERFKYREVDWSEERHAAGNIAANNPKIAGDFTSDLGELLEELETSMPDLSKGLRFDDLSKEFGESEKPDPMEDELPEPPKEPRAKLGDLYELGGHRLLCGDTTMSENVDVLVAGRDLKLIFTSPPYNMKANLYAGYRDNRNNSDFILFNIQVLMNWKRMLKSDGFVFWNMSYNKNSGASFVDVFHQFINNSGLIFLEDIVWDKGHGMPLSEQLTRQYEHILVLNESAENIHFIDHIGVFGAKRIPFIKSRKRSITNYWRIDTFRAQSENVKAAFPVALPLKAIEITTERGDIVADCFGGSGTTLIAAEKSGRRCFMMELDPQLCDVIVTRYCNFTGNSVVKLNGQELDWKATA